MGSNEEQVDAILNQIEKENSVDAVNEGLNILAKLVLNIIGNPFDVKFRHVKTSNNTIKTKIMNLKHIERLLEKLGYTRENQEMYTLRDEQLGDFLEGSPAIDYRRRLVSARMTSQAAYEKELTIISCHKAQQRQMDKRNEQTKRLKEKCQMDKLQRKHMKVDETKSNQLKFGSKANTFKDIGVDLCAKKGG